MRKPARFLISLLIFGITGIPQTALAEFQGDISISSTAVRFSDNYLLEGKAVKIYATVTNNSARDLLGTVKFFNKTKGIQIASDQPVSLFGGKTDDVFVEWTPAYFGTYKISVKIVPWQPETDDSKNNETEINAVVLQDTDRDGLANQDDLDDDGDGVPDENDKFPLDKNEWEDTDGDGKGDNSDEDDDNDSVPDTEDSFPRNPMEWEDNDKDGLGDNIDEDDDNDELEDGKELNIGTDPKNPDSDEDNVEDGKDAFPLDKSEWEDYDRDEIGDNKDEDDDNDGIPDKEDFNPKNKGPKIILKREPHFAPLNSPIHLDASDSYDEDGNIVKIEWEIDGKGLLQGEKIERTFPEKGAHTVKIIAEDNKGETRSMILKINVIDYALYLQICLFLILIGLAFVIFFQYIKPAKTIKK